ncbi:MAG TPA: heat-inducible transcriptional repressor HrcA [Vicinamibacterales bacterium]|jgi:heat-inducible transcriptional repressor|nr:heat-inducible transcriptional repressor HrcA [Vicinamibacterales bacterium]
MSSLDLSDRSRRLLATLVREYIETGEAVSSQVLARESGLGVSSATVRSVLVQLENSGYVHQPHTSAGRLPTDRAYRVFVDLLLETRKPFRPPVHVEQELRQQAVKSPLIDDLLAGVSHVVSRAARHVGFALAGANVAVLQRIEFVAIGGARVLVVVISRDNQVTQKVVDIGEEVHPDDLVQAANYLNTEFAGLPLVQVRAAVLGRLQQERTLYDQLLNRALRLAQSTLEELPQPQTFHVEGAASLLAESAADAVSLGTLRALLEMMEEKERLVHLLNQYIDGPGLTVVIGAEHASPDLRPFSLIASTDVDGGAIRTVGVIGPVRMHYSRAIALVGGATQAVSQALRHGGNQRNNEISN